MGNAPGCRGIRYEVLSISGAEGGIRTHTPVKVADFKSAASTIPPSRLSKLGLHYHLSWGNPDSEKVAEGDPGNS